MKKNKIAAAALALTLGLGALAPTLASADEAKKAEAKSETKSKKEKLTAVRDKATEVLAAAKLLVQLAPDTIKPVSYTHLTLPTNREV